MAEGVERRLASVEFTKALSEVSESNRITREIAAALQSDVNEMDRRQAAADARHEFLSASIRDMATNLQRTAEKAVTANTLGPRVDKLEDVAADLGKIVSAQQADIQTIKDSSAKSWQDSPLIKYGIAAGFLILIFSLILINPEAALKAVEIVKGNSGG